MAKKSGRQTHPGHPGRNRKYEVETAPDTEDLEAKRKRAPRVKTGTSSENATGRSHVQGRVRLFAGNCVSGGVQFPDCTSCERGSVLVITMSFHSRGILDVVVPVREVERDPLPPRGKSTNKVGCGRQTPACLVVVC